MERLFALVNSKYLLNWVNFCKMGGGNLTICQKGGNQKLKKIKISKNNCFLGLKKE